MRRRKAPTTTATSTSSGNGNNKKKKGRPKRDRVAFADGSDASSDASTMMMYEEFVAKVEESAVNNVEEVIVTMLKWRVSLLFWIAV